MLQLKIIFWIYFCFYILCMNVLPTCVYVYHMYAWSLVKVRRRLWIPWNWSYGWLWATVWVLGNGLPPPTHPQISTRVLVLINCWAVCPVLIGFFLFVCLGFLRSSHVLTLLCQPYSWYRYFSTSIGCLFT